MTSVHTIVYAAGVALICLGALLLLFMIAAAICELTPLGALIDRTLQGHDDLEEIGADAEIIEFRWPERRDAA